MIAERLHQLRKKFGYSKRQLLEYLPLKYSTYANYESGIREPSVDVLLDLADFYQVSIDYIAGATEMRKRAHDITHLSALEYDCIKRCRLLDEHEDCW